ncbi:MAG: MBL fold metallo-hydrolase [Patescibacteria group bacterium]|jgi:hypothetical protein|nr:MBL fold metallo-hydrolase [Patescibacteria group bacterium]
MEIQYYGGNCLTVTYKSTKLIIDDYLEDFGKKSIIKNQDTAIYTDELITNQNNNNYNLLINGPGEYEIGEISVIGIRSRSFIDQDKSVTMYKFTTPEASILITGRIFGEFNDEQMEKIGKINALIVPLGNNGYCLDPVGGLKLIKEIEPNIFIPTFYKSKDLKYPVETLSLDQIITELGMESSEAITKLKLKKNDISDSISLVILEQS